MASSEPPSQSFLPFLFLYFPLSGGFWAYITLEFLLTDGAKRGWLIFAFLRYPSHISHLLDIYNHLRPWMFSLSCPNLPSYESFLFFSIKLIPPISNSSPLSRIQSHILSLINNYDSQVTNIGWTIQNPMTNKLDTDQPVDSISFLLLSFTHSNCCLLTACLPGFDDPVQW